MNINLLNRQPPIYLQTLIFDKERGSCTAPPHCTTSLLFIIALLIMKQDSLEFFLLLTKIDYFGNKAEQ